MPRDERNNNEIQRNQQNDYYTDTQVTTGNVFTGEQKVVRRSTKWDHTPSAQEVGAELREMRDQANQLSDRGLLEQRNYETGNSSALICSRQNWDNTVDTLRNVRVPLYDNQGQQIAGQENIRREVARREAE
jgi:hypothetical protein